MQKSIGRHHPVYEFRPKSDPKASNCDKIVFCYGSTDNCGGLSLFDGSLMDVRNSCGLLLEGLDMSYVLQRRGVPKQECA